MMSQGRDSNPLEAGLQPAASPLGHPGWLMRARGDIKNLWGKLGKGISISRGLGPAHVSPGA